MTLSKRFVKSVLDSIHEYVYSVYTEYKAYIESVVKATLLIKMYYGNKGACHLSEPKRPTSLSLEEYAWTELRKMIYEGHFKPGEQLLQVELAEQLGISRTPLRRALANLEHKKLVEFSPRGEAFVAKFSPEEIANIFELRAVLEGLSCRLAAEVIERKHTAYLRSLMTSAFESIGSADDSEYRKADIEFHTYLAGLVANPFLQEMLDSYQIMHMSFSQGLLRTPQETFDEHMRILDALDQKDPDLAEQEMREHIRVTVEVMRQK